jgi:hypothetical protein
LPIGRFLKSKSLGGNRVILSVLSRRVIMMDRLIPTCVAFFFLLGCVGQTSNHHPKLLIGDDDTILDIVLSDLANYDGRSLPFSLGPKTQREIYFLREAIAWRPDAILPLEHDGVLSTLNSTERALVDEAIKNLTMRNESEFAFGNYQPTAVGIHVLEAAQPLVDIPPDVPYGALFPIQSWSPGYSDDKSCVVVHLHLSELMHPSAATYVLTRRVDGWTIKYRGFITWA